MAEKFDTTAHNARYWGCTERQAKIAGAIMSIGSAYWAPELLVAVQDHVREHGPSGDGISCVVAKWVKLIDKRLEETPHA